MLNINHKKMFKSKKFAFFFFLIVIVVLIIVGILIGLMVVGSHGGSDPNAPSPYTAVYMTSGDIYFGKLSTFPHLRLMDVWYLERSTAQNGQPQVGVAPFTSAFWGPVGDIEINSQSVLFYAPIKNGSQLVQAFENPSAVQRAAPQAPVATTTPSSNK